MQPIKLFSPSNPRGVSTNTTEEKPFIWTLGFATFTMAGLFIFPCIALLWRVLDNSVPFNEIDFSGLVTSSLLSLSTTLVSIIIIMILGTGMAYTLSRYTFPFKKIVTLFIELPIIMPPVVAGLGLLATFGRRGLLGHSLDFLGLQITFTPVAVVLAQVFVAAPFYIRTAQSSFNTIPLELEDAARIDGANNWIIFKTMILPLSFNTLVAGMLLSWARALGEFGATILFAGNLQGKTQTMPLYIYSALEQDLGATYSSALIMIILAGTMLGAIRLLTKSEDTIPPR